MSTSLLKELIAEEVSDYQRLSAKKGGSAPITLIEDVDIFVGKNEIKILCQAFIDDKLSEYDINYIMDALLLSSRVRFESEEFMYTIEILTDSQVNGKLTKAVVNEILMYCDELY